MAKAAPARSASESVVDDSSRGACTKDVCQRRMGYLITEMTEHIARLLAAYTTDFADYPRSILIPSADKYVPLEVANIAFIKAEMRMAKIYTLDGRSVTLDKSLDSMQQQLDPREFNRANRQYIIARRAIRDISHWFKSKLRVNLIVPPPKDIVVSNTSASDFKQWLTR